MIKCREFRKFSVLRSQITVVIHRDVSHSVRATFIHGDNFAIAYIRDGVRAGENLHGLARLLVHSKVVPHTQYVPNCRVFRSQAVKSESPGLLIADFTKLIEKGHHIQEPDGMFLVPFLEIKIRIVTR